MIPGDDLLGLGQPDDVRHGFHVRGSLHEISCAYPNWQPDLRNMLSLVWNRNSADPKSHGEVYSGAWALPETSVCCGTSLS